MGVGELVFCLGGGNVFEEVFVENLLRGFVFYLVFGGIWRKDLRVEGVFIYLDIFRLG